MNREEIMQAVFRQKIIAIVRGVYEQDCVQLAQALYAGGISIMEVTYDQSSAENQKRTVDTIRMVAEQMAGKMVVGAGTVTTPQMVESAHQAGARFVVSPDSNRAVIEKTRELDMVSMPGALTATEILTAYGWGADFVKVFPASVLGPAYIKAIRGPINHIPLLAVGGINEENLGAYLQAGVQGFGVGGNLANRSWVQAGEFARITELAKKYVENCRTGGMDR